MSKKNKYIVTGVVAVVGLGVAYWLYKYVSGKRGLTPTAAPVAAVDAAVAASAAPTTNT